MYGAAFCLVTAALGVDVGWQPLPDGGMEYIIQIEPQMLEMLKNGEQFESDIPPNLRGVRSYRITVGTEKLPRVGELPEPEAPPSHEVRLPSPTEFVPPLPSPVMSAQPAMSGGSPSYVGASEIPATLMPAVDTKPLPDLGERAAAFVNQPTTGPDPLDKQEKQKEEGTAQKEGGSEEAEPRKPWLPLSMALAGMFGSLGGMFYVGWVAWDYRRQYQALLARVIEAGGLPVDSDETMVEGNSVDDAG
ncbi:MAG TPA: hypothetical protein VMY37_02900 [Thermoguttaceae bacterium]|nr:hypothetical protein [Thermoguttaceae bacterium]